MKTLKYDDNYYYFLHDNGTNDLNNSEFYLNNDFLCRRGNELSATFKCLNIKYDPELHYQIDSTDTDEIFTSIIRQYRYYSYTDDYSVVVLKIPKKYFFGESLKPIWKKENIDSSDYHNNYYSIPNELIYGVYNNARDEFLFNSNYNENIDFKGRVYNYLTFAHSLAGYNHEETEKVRSGIFIARENSWREEKTYDELVEYDIANNTFHEELNNRKSVISVLKKLSSDFKNWLNQPQPNTYTVPLAGSISREEELNEKRKKYKK